MSEAENPRAVMGANNPPDPLIVEADERIDTAEKWLVERPEITDADMAAKASFFISQVDATHKALDGQRLEEKRKFLAGQEAKYSKPLGLLLVAKERLTKLRRAWLLREDARLEAERKAREEAARKAAEEVERQRKAAENSKSPLRAEAAIEEAEQKAEEARAAVEQVPDRAQIKGSYTRTAVSLREVWSGEITDLSAAFKHYNGKKHPYRDALNRAITECIQGFADKDAKLLKDPEKAPPGITFKMEKK